MPIPQSIAGSAPASPFSDPFGGAATLNARPSSPFVYLASAEAGSVRTAGLDEPTWLPELAIFRLSPGVQGVEVIKEGQPRTAAWTLALEQRRREGWVVLDPSMPVPDEFLPPGEVVGPYWRADAVYHLRSGIGGQRYREVWSQRLPSRRESAAPRFEFDRERCNRWLAWMVEQDLIPSPDAMARDEVIGQIEMWAASQARIVDQSLRDRQSGAVMSRLDMHRAARVIEPGAETPAEPKKRARK